jgi:hypothetical protein
MAKFLRILLDAKEPMFTATLRQLEKMTGHKGVDIAYIADITERAHTIMRKIGLDPADTSELELYKALSAHAHDDHLFAGSDDVALIFGGNRIVSFNYDDIRENTTRTYELRTFRHMQCQLQHGLTARYVAADGDDEVMIDQMIAQSGVAACDLSDYHEQKSVQQKATTQAPYILCIGDIFTDVFIKLLENEARIDTDKDGSKRLSVPFGSKPPYERADVVTSVGPSPNAAVSMARLGARVGLMSWLGDDQTGKDSLKYLAHESIDTSPMIIQKNTPSNTYYVLRYGADRTILSDVTQSETIPQVVAVDADWSTQQRAKKLDGHIGLQFTDGGALLALRRAARDAIIAGEGFARAYEYGDEVAYERIHPLSVLCDDRACVDVEPREFCIRRAFSRDHAKALWPRYESEIDGSPRPMTPW